MGTSYADAIMVTSDDSSHCSFDSMSLHEQPAEKLLLRGIYEEHDHLNYFICSIIMSVPCLNNEI